MRHIHCLNNISAYGTDLLTEDYSLTDDVSQAAGVLVRSAAMHDMEFPEELLAIARAGAGVNNIPLDRCAEEGIVVFNTPGANANAVKELVLCGMLLGSRGIVDGIAWCRENADDPNIAKAVEKAKKQFAGCEIKGKKLGFEGGGLRFETMQALGASVVGMNMSDLYQAMQGGIIDGIVMDFDPLISRRYGEEVKHVTLLNITGTAFYVVMNQERYDSLPDDLKAIVDDMSQNYGPNLLEKFWAENVYGSLDKWIKEMGGTVHVLSDEDYARADKLAAVPAQAWFKSLDKAGYRGAELEKTFHQLEAKYFTPWRQSEAYRYVKQQ